MTTNISKYDSGRVARPVIERIKARCTITATGCWIWQGTTVKGYGRTVVGSRRDDSRRQVLTHRATWEARNGPVPDGLTLDHVVCDEPLCANPEHTAPATMWDNTKRSPTSPTAVNARKTHCSKCGGPLTPKKSGSGRQCRPCYLDYLREYNARRNGHR